MRHLVERFHVASAAVTLVSRLAGCGRTSPADETATMSLLRAGSEKVCVAGDMLHLFSTQERSFDVTGSITRADPISFTVQFKDDEPLSLRRCTRAETETLPQPDDNGSAAE